VIGYHYTTREAWESIQYGGMSPAPLRQHEYDGFLTSLPTLPRDAIWVWKEELSDHQAFIVLTSLAVMHDSFDIVLLAIDYEPNSSASIACKEYDNDFTRLTCDFSMGRLSTGKLSIDLILNDVPAANITKLWSGNLMAPFRGRHKSEAYRKELAVA